MTRLTALEIMLSRLVVFRRDPKLRGEILQIIAALVWKAVRHLQA